MVDEEDEVTLPMPKGLRQVLKTIAWCSLFDEKVLQLLDTFLSNTDIIQLARVEAVHEVKLGFRLQVEVYAYETSSEN